jgi:hypothetical protein
LKIPLPEPKVVKMGYANMLLATGFVRPNPRMFLVDKSIQDSEASPMPNLPSIFFIFLPSKIKLFD